MFKKESHCCLNVEKKFSDFFAHKQVLFKWNFKLCQLFNYPQYDLIDWDVMPLLRGWCKWKLSLRYAAMLFTDVFSRDVCIKHANVSLALLWRVLMGLENFFF